MKYSVDRIEENTAILVCFEDESTLELSCASLPDGVLDGDTVEILSDGSVYLLKEESEIRLENARNRFDRLKKK